MPNIRSAIRWLDESLGRLSKLILGVFVPLLAVALSGCDQPAADINPKPKAAVAATVVTVSRPITDDVVEWDEYTARFDAVEAVDIRARISGHLTEILFKDGQTVKKGDPLFVIDPRSFERVVELARAELAQASTKVENATLDVDRGRPLVERRVMSDKAFDDRANILREAQAAVKVAQAKLASAELDLAFTRIDAPIGGRIGRAMVTTGNWVSSGAISNTTLLTTIVSESPIYVYFDISENNFLKYKRLLERSEGASGAGQSGAELQLAMPDETGFAHRGKLDFLDNRLDPGTATLRARAIVENREQLFSPGMFARVRIAGSPKYRGFLLPDSAIGTDQASKYVLVVDGEDTVARRSVTLGPLHRGLRIVREGVTADDWVIVKGIRSKPGQKVAPQREEMKLSESVTQVPATTGSITSRN
jgi:RND family efflux transporter MFP subunit